MQEIYLKQARHTARLLHVDLIAMEILSITDQAELRSESLSHLAGWSTPVPDPM